jgi:hypothetical protein
MDRMIPDTCRASIHGTGIADSSTDKRGALTGQPIEQGGREMLRCGKTYSLLFLLMLMTSPVLAMILGS